MDCPLDYSLCDRVVTVYHREEGVVTRQVLEGCCYLWQQAEETDTLGTRQETRFLLILPGDSQRICVGDRVYDGVGPEEVDWSAFIPARVPGLAQAAYVRPCWWGSRICHYEAGRK